MTGPSTEEADSADEAAAYRAAVEALQARGRFGIRLGLARVRALLRALGDPHRDLRGALVTGTNGKGSVQAIVAAIVHRAGYRVGQTPSPHLVTYRERILVDCVPIPAGAFAELVARVLAVESPLASRHGHATEFELLTAAAFAHFRSEEVGVGAVEVGMGGRLDATNAWDGGVAAITNVDWDHADRLGPTLEAIAAEKAAIIKPGDLAITAAGEPGLGVIQRHAERVGAPLRVVSPLEVVAHGRDGLRLHHPRLGDVRLALLGRHQAANAAVALAIVEALVERDIVAVDDEAIRGGAAEVRWPGRLELLRIEPGVDLLLDGAHNEAGMAALAAALDELSPSLAPGRATVLLGLLADKDVAAVTHALLAASALDGARIIATRVPSARTRPPEELAEALRQAAAAPGREVEIEVREQVGDAIAAAVESAVRRDGPLVVAGSLYLVGEVRGMLVDDPSLRDPA